MFEPQQQKQQEDFGSFQQRLLSRGRLGSCDFFDPKPFIDVATQLAIADEPLRAIEVLENLPAFYRDNIPAEISELKKKILSKIATPTLYQQTPYDTPDPQRNAYMFSEGARGESLLKDVISYNKQGLTPHIVDLGPGDYWLATVLPSCGVKFTYYDIGLNYKARELAMQWMRQHWVKRAPENAPQIFFAGEIIEHLYSEKDILAEYYRHNVNAEIIHMTTPYYTFDGRSCRYDLDKVEALPHLRTYTPNEFYHVCCKLFPQHDWVMTVNDTMCMRGVRKK